jgi:predicted nucleic acid-binding Zn ribbon protein
MSSRGDDMTIKEAIDKMLDVYKLRRKFDETSLVAAWPKLMGKAIANRTKQLYIRDKKLFVKLDSRGVKSELILMRSQIIGRLNEYVGQAVIEDLVVL